MFALILAAILPCNEMSMVKSVSEEYKLNREQTALLIAIRKFENGKPGLEFGVGEASKDHPAHRYRDGRLSFIIQARWAACTIRRRYKGDLKAFARRYCPLNSDAWEKGVGSIMRHSLKEIW